MTDILLTTLNARYSHAAIGLRYLQANMGHLADRTRVLEFTIKDHIHEVCERLLAQAPKIIGIGVYIWNAEQAAQLLATLKKISPKTTVVLGGPEVSHLPHRVDFSKADYIIRGEGESCFTRLCQDILDGRPPQPGTIEADPVDLAAIALPYALYTDEDIAHRVLYAEASRGCPFTCEFCLSSLDRRVRRLDVDRLLGEIEQLWQRGARQIKFVDRTFNLHQGTVCRLLDFFLTKQPPYLIHFEVIPDHLPVAVRDRLRRFQPGVLQLEVGIQTLQPEIAANINRRLNIPAIRDNLRFLDAETSVHLHLDLIAGLPGESLEEFGANLNALAAMSRAEIQLGVLKKLSGTSLCRHDHIHGMIYSDHPPYELLANDQIPFPQMQDLKRMARFWDLVYNSGNFQESAPLLWPDGDVFHGFLAFSRWLYRKTAATWQIALGRLAELLFFYLTEECGLDHGQVADTLAQDVLTIRGRTLPESIRQHARHLPEPRLPDKVSLGKRQQRHL